jgi:hypothetical protein
VITQVLPRRTDTQKKAMAIEQDQVNRANKSTDDYNKSLGLLAKGGKIATNPWTDPTYLRNQNLIASGTSSAINNAAKDQLDTEAQRTGSNTASRGATIADLARQKMRTQTDYMAGRDSENYNRYLDWERFILGAKLAPTNVNTSLFGTAAGQVSNANQSLIGFANANNQASAQMWGSIIGGAASGLGAAAGGGAFGKA